MLKEEQHRIVAGTGTKAYSYRTFFLGSLFDFLGFICQGLADRRFFGYGDRADDTMGGIYRLGAAFALISDVRA